MNSSSQSQPSVAPESAIGSAEPAAADVALCCIVCTEPFRGGDLYLPDESGGFIHRACCGPERESFTLDGEPLKPGDPIPEGYVWSGK